ncbi:MAG: hypothetical protein WAP35_00055 [Solirubrobacterales bacterium]
MPSRKTLLLAVTVLATCVLLPVSSAAAAPSPAKTRVIVTLNVDAAVAAVDQSAAIAQSTDALLAVMPAGTFEVINRPVALPYLTLAVSPHALSVLKTSGLVTAVEADKTVSASTKKKKCKTVKLKDGSKVKMCKKASSKKFADVH